MIRRILVTILLALPLVSFAPVPAPLPLAMIVQHRISTTVVPRARTIERVRLAIQTGAPTPQACTFETAQSKLSVAIADPIGYPYGFVTAFSCSGDGLAVANELAQRAAALQAEAAAYRAAHPIAGRP